MDKKNSKIEMLRIIAIILIVLSHYVVHSGTDVHNMPVSINRFILELGVLGNIGTMLFVFITGYFLIKSSQVKLKKIIHFWVQVFFYSFFIYVLVVILNREPFNIIDLLVNSFPITFKRYWFATVYFIIYLFHPYINKFINSLSRKEHSNFIVISVFIFFILSTLTTMDFYENELIYFIVFYSIGAYMSKYKDNIFYNKNNSKKMLLFSISTIVFSTILFDVIGIKIAYFGKHSNYLLNLYSIAVLLLSLSVFGIFTSENLNTNTNKKINYISSLVFGVYLISDNKYMRKIIWVELLNNQSFFSSNYLIIHMIFSVILVFVVCLLLEAIRKFMFSNLFYKWLDPKIDKMQQIIDIKMKKQKKVL